MREGFVSEDAAERIADAVGLTVGEILLPEISGHVENVIEFIKDSERATVTFCQGHKTWGHGWLFTGATDEHANLRT